MAALEVLAHLRRKAILQRFVLIAINFDDSMVTPVAELPPDWRRRRRPPPALQHIGDEWAASSKSLVLRVPSVLVPGESNYVINPAHPAFPEIAVLPPVPFRFDPRLKL